MEEKDDQWFDYLDVNVRNKKALAISNRGLLHFYFYFQKTKKDFF